MSNNKRQYDIISKWYLKAMFSLTKIKPGKKLKSQFFKNGSF